MDGVLIANELIDSRKRVGKEGVILKIDLEKLMIMWNGILWIICWAGLGFAGHGGCGCGIVLLILLFSMLVNGSPSRLFMASRGLFAKMIPSHPSFLLLWQRL